MGKVFLLLGPEKGLKEDFINKTKASIGSCEVSRFYAFEDYEEELYAQLNNSDLFANAKLIILDEAQEIKTKDKIKGIVDYIKNPSDCVTFLISSSELYISAEIMNAVSSDNILKFYELFENKKSEWIKNFFRRYNLGVADSAISAITEKVDNNIQEFESVCIQLSVYLKSKDQKLLTDDIVEEFLVHTKQENYFTLFSYIANCNLSGALECVQALLHTTDEAGVAAVIASRLATYFRRLYSLHMNVASGMYIDNALKTKYFDTDRAIVVPKDKEVYKNAFANYKLLDVQHILGRLAEYDISIKEAGTFLHQTVIEKCIVDIIVHKCA